MKKWLTMLLVATMTMLAACGQNGEEDIKSNTTSIEKGNKEKENKASTEEIKESKEAKTTIEKVVEETEVAYYLPYGETKIHLTDPAEEIFAVLGEPIHFFEADSCAFQGKDRVYNYPGLEIQTYEYEGKEYILSMMFIDDTVETKEGIYLGISKEEMLAIYGEGFVQQLDLYMYRHMHTELAILIEDDVVASIEYRLLKEEVVLD